MVNNGSLHIQTMSVDIRTSQPEKSGGSDGKGLSKMVNGRKLNLTLDLSKRFQTRATPDELVMKNIMRGMTTVDSRRRGGRSC